LLEARLDAAEWSQGLELVRNAADRKIVPPVTAERARAALLTALAGQADLRDPKARGQALDSAVEAAKLQPGFAPAADAAARLLAADNKAGRAQAALEAAWKVQPHPALWLAYRDLKTDETPAERAKRLGELMAQNPNHREGRILAVERALIAGDAPAARQALGGLDAEPVTARVAGLRARVAYVSGQPDEARLWLAQGINAPSEPVWSDLDAEGRAFAYAPADWARVVMAYAETGELIHPRFERREKGLSELPELPIAYADAASFLAAADGREPQPYLDDPEGYDEAYGDDEEPPADPSPAPARRRGGGRRLASGPRAAK
jgi:HemY protein